MSTCPRSDEKQRGANSRGRYELEFSLRECEILSRVHAHMNFTSYFFSKKILFECQGAQVVSLGEIKYRLKSLVLDLSLSWGWANKNPARLLDKGWIVTEFPRFPHAQTLNETEERERETNNQQSVET